MPNRHTDFDVTTHDLSYNEHISVCVPPKTSFVNNLTHSPRERYIFKI